MANHTHEMAHITDAGSVATLNSIGTSDIDNNAVTAAKLSPAVGVDGQVLSLSGGNLTWVAGQAGASSFTALDDTPSSYTANPGDILQVNSGTNGLEFTPFAVKNIGQITTVNSGTAGKVLAVDANNQGSSGYKGLKWVDTSQVGATTFSALTDTPSSIGTAHQLLTVNAAGTDLEYRTLDANHISTGLITSAMIADGTITGSDIAGSTITSTNLVDLTVSTVKIENSAITTQKLAADAVDGTKIADDSIDSEHYVDGSIDTAHIADDAITAAKIGDISQIGGTDTYTDWDIVNDTKIDWYVNGSNEMQLLANGTLHVDGDVIAYSSSIASDKNLKDNITNIDNPIEKVKQLNGVTFNWKKNGKESGGVIAQEVQQVLPGLVSQVQELNDSTSHLAVDYNGIIGLLVETVKEQQKQIDDLKSRI